MAFPVRWLDVAGFIIGCERVSYLVRRFPPFRGWIDPALAETARQPKLAVLVIPAVLFEALSTRPLLFG